MFERFSAEARAVVAGAQDEARTLGQPYIGTEHLLLAMLTHGGVGGDVLLGHGLSAAAVRERIRQWDSRVDPDALATIGIDLDAVRRAAEDRFGPGALAPRAKPMPAGNLRLTKRAKHVLGLALREAVDRQAGSIDSGHLILGIIREHDGLAMQIIRATGVDVDALAVAADRRAGRRAA